MIEKSPGVDSTKRGSTRTAARLSRLYLDALRANDAAAAFRIVSAALVEGFSLPQLYQQVVAPAMYELGALWEKGAITVADEHLATALTHRVLAALRSPLQVEAPIVSGGDSASPEGRTALLAAVEGEQHALGLRMAADVLEDAGFRTIYLGADVPTVALLQAVDALSPDLVALSATMPELAPRLEEVAAAVRGAHPGLAVLVGGQAASPRVEGEGVPDLAELPGRLAPT